MKSDFEEVWSDIRQLLLPGTLVRYWSVEEGYPGGAFRVDGTDGNSVSIEHVQISQKTQVSKRELQQLFAFWSDYLDGAIGRLELSKKTQNTTYALSILKWHEDTKVSPAPVHLLRTGLRRVNPVIGETPAAGVVSNFANHQEYGYQVLHAATEGRAVLSGPSVEIDYGTGLPAHVCATVGQIAIEIESGAEKQVRGAVLNLICHSHPKKLLLLMPDYMTSRGIVAEQCRNILRRFCPEGSFRIAVLKGSSSSPRFADDAAVVAAVLADLRASG